MLTADYETGLQVFDLRDGSDFASRKLHTRAMRFKQQKQRARYIAQQRTAAAAQMAHQLAHEINNPLQSMTNTAYLIAQGNGTQDPRVLGQELSNQIFRLSGLVKMLLAVPFQTPSN